MSSPVVNIHIRRVSTQEVRVIDDSCWDFEHDDENIIWQWTEGNNGCDCNRLILGWDEKMESVQCGECETELIAIFKNGKQIYPELLICAGVG